MAIETLKTPKDLDAVQKENEALQKALAEVEAREKAATEKLAQILNENTESSIIQPMKLKKGEVAFFANYPGCKHITEDKKQIIFRKMFSDRQPCYVSKDPKEIEYLKAQGFRSEDGK